MVKLTGRASRFVGLLHDFGHLDEASSTDFLVALSEVAGEGGGRVDLPDVRRFAAAWLFGVGGGVADKTHLTEDWPILFS